MASQEEINTLLELLSTLPNCPITTVETRDLVRSMYFAALGDIPFQWLQAAYLQYIGQDKPFFPANPGTLREIAFDLEMTAQGVPTPSMAWAIVLSATQKSSIQRCQTAEGIAETLAGLDRPGIIKTPELREKIVSLQKEYFEHYCTCRICVLSDTTKIEYEYSHEVVARVVYLMGGRDVIFTDNATADRARFLDAYRELVLIERKRLQMHPKVAELIADPERPQLGQAGAAVRLLALQMGGG